MTPRSLQDLYVYQLRDLYSAERQLAEALPDVIERAAHEDLKAALRSHLAKTEVHRERLDEIFRKMGTDPGGETCHAMKGLIRETKHFFHEVQNIIREDAPPAVVDAGIVANVQRIEHYEIAGYGTVRHYAEVLGRAEDAALLEATLQEEKEADQQLNDLAKRRVNLEAMTT